MKSVTNGFARLSYPQFRRTLDVIVNAMTGNHYFPTLQTQVAALSQVADKYYDVDTRAESRDKNLIVQRNTLRTEVTNRLHQLGFGVSAVCNGNEDMLTSSAFPITRTRQKTLPLQPPSPPRLSAGANKGVINVKSNKQKGTISYNYYITPATGPGHLLTDEAIWDVTSHNASNYAFTNLASAQPYFIKVGLVGVRGQEVISDAISYTAQ